MPKFSAPVIMQLGLGRVSIYLTCGEIGGSWRATSDGQLVTYIDMASQTCLGSGTAIGQIRAPAWLRPIGHYTITGNRLTLLSASGSVAAQFSRADPNVQHPTGGALPITPDPRESHAVAFLASPAPLPNRLPAATSEGLIGTWVPTRAGSTAKAFLRFRSDNSWTGSDGCNGAGGNWLVAPNGEFAGVSGASTLIGCNNVDVGGWVYAATRASILGTTLQFYDVTGRLLGSLTRRS